MTLDEENLLLPKLGELIAVYEAAMVMAEARDRGGELNELARRQGFLMAYVALIRPKATDTTQPLF